MNEDILSLIKEKGILLEKDLFEILNNIEDKEKAKILLDSFERASGKKIITVSSLSKNIDLFKSVINNSFSGDMKGVVEKTFVKLGLSLEVKKEIEIIDKPKQEIGYKLFYTDNKITKKIDFQDFVGHFRARYQQIQRMLLARAELQNLISINKISGERKGYAIIGIVREKRKTPSQNLMITFEDLTGKIKVLVKANSECFAKAEELRLDDVVGVKAAGNMEILFAQDIIYPDSIKDKVRFESDVCVAFVSDVHAGSNKHLGEEFEKFLDWINSDHEMAKKINYIFFVGDNVDGVGVYPGQESGLKLKSLKEQYSLLASYLRRIPSRITMFMCPGQHDSVRVAEPQPIIDNFYGAELHTIPNLILVPNPTQVNLLEGEKEFKVLMYHGASIHSFINDIEELRLLKAHKCPAKAVKHMLKRRHLAPTHSSVVYVPNGKTDPLVISEPPDVLCTGEVHRLDIENYNGTLIITGSCWQSQTDFEEKVGNIPDPCKVPVFNLRTRELSILDFTK